MRSFYTAALLGMIAGLFPLCAHATGNVLVPSNTNSSSILGITPQQQDTPTPAPTPTPVAVTTPPPAQSLPVTSVPPSMSPAAATSAMPRAGLSLATVPGSETRIMKMPAIPAAAPDMSGMNLAKSVSIEVRGGWTETAMKLIGDQLGIPANRIASMCQNSVSGVLATDKGGMPFFVNPSMQATGRYDGTINAVMLSTAALCNTDLPLPSGSNIVMQAGDKYLVNLGTSNCQLSNTRAAPSKITITTQENGALNCQVQ